MLSLLRTFVRLKCHAIKGQGVALFASVELADVELVTREVNTCLNRRMFLEGALGNLHGQLVVG